MTDVLARLDTDAASALIQSTRVDEVTTALVITDQLAAPFWRGSFVAKYTTAIFRIAITGLNLGSAYTNFKLIVGGPAQATPIYDTDSKPVAPATGYRLGSISADSKGSIFRSVTLTGLTVGVTYPWIVTVAQTGGSLVNSSANSGTPAATFANLKALALRYGIAGKADKGWWLNKANGAGTSQLIPFTLGGRGGGNRGLHSGRQNGVLTANPNVLPTLGAFESYGSQIPTSATPGPSTSLTQPAWIAVTPDGTQIVIVGSGNPDATVHVLNADTEAINGTFGPTTNNANAISGVTAVGASTTYTSTAHPFAIGDVIYVNGTTPTTLQGIGTITAITTNSFTMTMNAATSGAWSSGGTAYRLFNGAGGVVCDNTYAYISDTYSMRVVRIKLSDRTYQGGLILDSSGLASRIAMSPDGSKLATTTTTGKVRIINVGAWTLGALIDLSTLGAVAPAGAIGTGTWASAVSWTDNDCIWVVAQTATQGTLVRVQLSSGAKTAYILPYASPNGIAAATRPTGAHGAGGTGTVVVTSGSATVTDDQISHADEGRAVSGTGVPVGSYVGVGTVVPGVSFGLSSSATTNIAVNATAPGTAVSLYGSNNLWVIYSTGKASQHWISGPYLGGMFTPGTVSSFGGLANPDAQEIVIDNLGNIYVALGLSNVLWEWPGSSWSFTPNDFNNDYATVGILGGV